MTDSRSIDWPAVHRKLETSQQRLEQAFAPLPETVEHTLEARARALAARLDRSGGAAGTPENEQKTLLLLEVGDHLAGIELHWLQEVLPLPHAPVPVPEAHDLLLGVFNAHNQFINLINPWPLLQQQPPGGAVTFPQAILLRHPRLRLALGCTRVLDLLPLPEAAWQSERHFLSPADGTPGVLLDAGALLDQWVRDLPGTHA